MAFTKKAERTKGKLLASARKLISERGFDHVSVEDITKDSGVAKGTFYHYFKCKEDVVKSLSDETAAASLRNTLAYEGGVVERCNYYFLSVYRDCQWNGVRLVRQWMRESIETEQMSTETEETLCYMYSAMEKIVTIHQGEGPGELVKEAPVEKVCRILVSHLIGVITMWCMLNGSFDMSKDPDEHTRMDIQNLLGPFLIQ